MKEAASQLSARVAGGAGILASPEAPPDPAGARAGLLELGDADAMKEAASQHSARVAGGAAAGVTQLPSLALPLLPTPPAQRKRPTSVTTDRSGSTLAPVVKKTPKQTPVVKKTPKQTLAHDLAERGLRVIVIPGDGHCLFGAFSMSRHGTPAKQSSLRQLLANVLRRPDFATLYPIEMAEITAEGFASVLDYAQRVVRPDHLGTFADASVLCGELGWRLAVYNTIVDPPHDSIEYVQEPPADVEGLSKVLELLHWPNHWDLLERVESASAPSAAQLPPPIGQAKAGAPSPSPERGRVSPEKLQRPAPLKPGPLLFGLLRVSCP